MITFPRILFPVDLSEQSHAAAPYVRAMAARFHSEVTLLHVIEVPPAWYGPAGEVSFSAWVDMSGISEARHGELRDFVTREFSGVDVRPCIQSGDPASIIQRVAHQRQMSLIMMPTHGYGPIRSLLLGSVTAKVLHDAECPVWTAKLGRHPLEHGALDHAPLDHEPPDREPPDRERSWRHFLCAVDSDLKEVSLVKWAAHFAIEQGAKLDLVHAISGFEQQQCACSEDPLREFVFSVAEERISKLQEQAGTELDVRVSAGRTGQVLREAAFERQADLILIGRGVIQRPLGRLRSNAYAIVHDAPCPVISI